jgi:uncharacterized membrane protein (DUF4010 family)
VPATGKGADVDVVALRPYVEAAAMGLGIGLEREWNNRTGEQQSAGSRTFAVLALTGAVAASLGDGVIAAGAVGVAALLVVGYARTAKADRGSTTEAAAFATYLLGALLRSDAEVAVGLAVVMAVLLAAKGPIHHLAREVVTATEVQDALRFFVIAFVVLPLLPDRKVGPYGVLNPSRIWLLVVAITGIGWLGYIAVRGLGAQRGLVITGFAGGFISATATTASMGRLARQDPTRRWAAVIGAIAASAATLIEIGLITAVANPDLLARLAPALAIGLAVIAIELSVVLRRQATADQAEVTREQSTSTTRPFAFWPALVLAAMLTLVLLVARWGTDLLGSGGALITGAVAGFADAHATVLGMATLALGGSISTHSALAATGLALATNTASKCALAFAAGGREFGVPFVALLVGPAMAVAVATAAALV